MRDEKYFVLHAPRQTGKTSALLALAEVLNERGYHCVYVTVETARTARDDVPRAMRVVLAALAEAADAALGDRFLGEEWPDLLAMGASGSPFNIAAASLRLGDFSRQETLALLGQHTAETGQPFTPEALEAVWTQTRGQPWLVNALACGACFENTALREDRARPVTAAAVAAAREDLIVERVTHLDYLADKLREERVRRVIEPLLTGSDRHAFSGRDVGYARDLGLIARDAPVRIANPIYAEVLPRELAWVAQETLDLSPRRYVKADGSLDAALLLGEFQGFFRRHSEHWRDRFAYAEAWPQLLLQAYLQRVVNGGGRIEREYALGSGRVDLLIVWPLAERVQEVECKVVRERDGLARTIDEGVEQTARYVERCAAEAGRLVVIDCRENRSWEEKLFHQRRSGGAAPVDVWGM